MTNKITKFGLVGLALAGATALVDIDTASFKYPVPVGINWTEAQKTRVFGKAQQIQDTYVDLAVLGERKNIFTVRKVVEPSTGKSYSGILTPNGDVVTSQGTHKLENAHEATWYR